MDLFGKFFDITESEKVAEDDPLIGVKGYSDEDIEIDENVIEEEEEKKQNKRKAEPLATEQYLCGSYTFRKYDPISIFVFFMGDRIYIEWGSVYSRFISKSTSLKRRKEDESKPLSKTACHILHEVFKLNEGVKDKQFFFKLERTKRRGIVWDIFIKILDKLIDSDVFTDTSVRDARDIVSFLEKNYKYFYKLASVRDYKMCDIDSLDLTNCDDKQYTPEKRKELKKLLFSVSNNTARMDPDLLKITESYLNKIKDHPKRWL